MLLVARLAGVRCAAALLGLLLAACQAPPAATERQWPPPPSTAQLNRERTRALRSVEAELRAGLDVRKAAPWIDVSGADPYRLLARPGGGFVGILRGAKALVLLDDGLAELTRVPLSEAPTALCLAGSSVYVASRWSSELTRVDLASLAQHVTRLNVEGVADLACGDDQFVHVLSAGGASLLTLREGDRLPDRREGVPGGLRLLRVGRYLLAISLFERSLRVLELSTRGVPERELGRVTHDGPIWAAAAMEHDGQLLVALSGAEDKPLVRAHGEFENIDSFVWLYRISSDGASRVASINVGEYGLIVPKAVSLTRAGSEIELAALAAGSGKLLRARFPADLNAEPRITTLSVPPGASDAAFEGARVSYPSPLLDAWVQVRRGGVQLVHVDPETRPPLEVRIGEALFTTELMAPSNTSEGSHSRFTCETCHFEGGVDGRTHHTGRGEVSVVTKALFGLASNRPHFSRARDPDLSSVSHNEFRVAGAGSGRDPWFSIETSDYPWLAELGLSRARLSPLELRRALLTFLYAFNHAPNVNLAARGHFDELERAGAKVFSARCAGCHAPRLRTDEASSEVAFEAWEPLIFARNAPLTWARGEYARTGIEPYVDERGTRITSLRRLALKPRYFTNGSAADLGEVLERFRDASSGGLHSAPAGTQGALDSRERRALVAFLRLL